ncbi:hypothetical protein Tco_0295083 [Tanacetum coccineum]
MSQPANDDFFNILVMMKHHTMKMHQTMAMEMEHYLEYIDNDVWKVIQNGNSKKRISTGKDGVVKVLPPVSAAETHAFEAFTISSSEGLEKGYNRFQQLLSQLEAHGAEVSTEDANHKFLRSLPPAWSNLAMTMRTKPDVDTLSIDDLYNNLRFFEQELTSTSKSSAKCSKCCFCFTQQSTALTRLRRGHTVPTLLITSSTSLKQYLEREKFLLIAMIANRMKKFSTRSLEEEFPE